MTCECSEDFGPCEQHADLLVSREGASLHSADELALLLVSDLKDCGIILSRYDQGEYDRLSEAIIRDPVSGVEQLPDDDVEAAQDLAQRIESQAHGLWIDHNDGYTIVRPHPDCPLLEA